MVRTRSKVKCVDNTGVIMVRIFQVVGNKLKREATFGDKVYVVVRAIDTNLGNMWDEKQKRRFRIGSIHRAVVVHLSQNYTRKDRSTIKFLKNAIVLVDKKGVPLAKRIKAVIPREVAKYYPGIGAISERII